MSLRATLVIVFVVSIAASAMAQSTPTGVRGWFLNEVNALEKKYVSLAEAVPQEKFTWRPGTGVRSIAEVHTHVAIANFRIPSAMGITSPAIEPKEMTATTDKAKVIDYLKQSFEHLRAAVNSVTDEDLNKDTKLFGRPAVYRDVLLAISTHMHEHLGQSIAYARVNNITPPWSQQ